MGFCSQEVTSYHLQGELKPRAADHRAWKKTGRSAPEPKRRLRYSQGTRPKVFSMDEVIGWIVMTAAVVPAVLTLLLAWSGSNRRPNPSQEFAGDKRSPADTLPHHQTQKRGTAELP